MLDSRGNVAGTEAQGTIAPIHTVDGLSGSSTDFFYFYSLFDLLLTPIYTIPSFTYVCCQQTPGRQSRFGLLDLMIFG